MHDVPESTLRGAGTGVRQRAFCCTFHLAGREQRFASTVVLSWFLGENMAGCFARMGDPLPEITSKHQRHQA